MSGIVFQVETMRVLQILSREIYDSPMALLRENLQNAYDAVRMRFVRAGKLSDGGRIDIDLADGAVSIADNGVGMTESVLRGNFWKAGSSGKHTDAARRAGVVGTFGIGAMANFGVCSRLTVETHAEGSTDVLRSSAERESLKIAEECITLERVRSNRDIGTTVIAELDTEHRISIEQARQYLEPYIGLLPVPIFLNGQLISGGTIEARLQIAGRSFSRLASKALSDNLCAATFDVHADTNGQVLVFASDITLGGNGVEGSMALLQSGGQLMGFRSSFGLAPVPAAGAYQFGGVANLSFLQPTAGREALSRESIEQMTQLLDLAERAASELLAVTPAADMNNSFLQWLGSHGRYDLANRLSIRVFPGGQDVELGKVSSHVNKRPVHYYTGTDDHILMTFSNENLFLLQVARANPRHRVQLHYVVNILNTPQVPDTAQITHVYKGTELTLREASVLIRITAILRDDYLIPDVQIFLADISHRVAVLSQKDGEQLRVHIARSSNLMPPLLECYDRAYDVFPQFTKDFVRVHIYPQIQQFVPSSTRDGVDALRRLLLRNRELYRYEETERGDLEGILGEYLSGTVTLAEVLKVTRSAARSQSQRVSHEQVGTIELVVPDVVASPISPVADEAGEFAASPPIIRDEVSSDMKILTTREKHRQLNDFTMLLGLSDRLMHTEADFFRTPHTTRILWGGHRVIYIFAEATGRLSLYYDIELREPIEHTKAGGGMFPTTTLVTKKRIFVPVPDPLTEAFKIAAGAKEFFVRFDLLTSDVD